VENRFFLAHRVEVVHLLGILGRCEWWRQAESNLGEPALEEAGAMHRLGAADGRRDRPHSSRFAAIRPVAH